MNAARDRGREDNERNHILFVNDDSKGRFTRDQAMEKANAHGKAGRYAVVKKERPGKSPVTVAVWKNGKRTTF